MSDGNVRHRRVDQIAVERPELLRIVAALRHLVAILRIAQHGDEHLVELQIAAAGVGEAAHRLLVGVAEIVPEPVHRPGRPACRSASSSAARRSPTAPGMVIFGVRLVCAATNLKCSTIGCGPGHAELAGDLHAFVARRRPRRSAMPVSMTCFSAPSRPQRKSRCHHERRNSPSVMACRPTSSCFLMTRSISRSSISFSASAVISPLARLARASWMRFGRSRLPTWSARNGGLVVSFSCPSCDARTRLRHPDPVTLAMTAPTPRRRAPRSCGASPIVLLRPGYCLPRSRQSRIAATGRADRAARTSPPRRCGA